MDRPFAVAVGDQCYVGDIRYSHADNDLGERDIIHPRQQYLLEHDHERQQYHNGRLSYCH